MKVEHFNTIAADFIAAVHSQVWCNVATVDTGGRPRSRVLHPIWELHEGGTVGWIATGRSSLKAKHLAHNPHVSLVYMKDPLKPVYVDCHTEWAEDMGEKQRVWQWFGTTPPPLGYDLTPFFGSVDSPEYGLLKLTPHRIELGDLFGEARVWRG